MSSLTRFTRFLGSSKAASKTLAPTFFRPFNNLNYGRARLYHNFKKTPKPKNAPQPQNIPPPPSPHSTPTPSQVRSYNSSCSTKKYLVYAIIGLNTAVFGYGIFTKAQAKQGYRENFSAFLQTMTLNLNQFIDHNRWYTALTSNYTHLDLVHFGANMMTFYFISDFLVYMPVMTPGRMVILILGSGFLGSIGSLVKRYVELGPGTQDAQVSLGFSGALMGVNMVAACFFPTAKVQLFGVVPLQLWMLAAGYLVYDGYYLNSQDTRIGHAGHLGGAVFGVAYYMLRLWGLRRVMGV